MQRLDHLLPQLLSLIVESDAIGANSPIVIVNNNHNNQPVGTLLNTPHFIFNNVSGGSDGLMDGNLDSGPPFDELTTPVIPAGSNSGSITSLDEQMNGSSASSSDPFSSLFFTDPVLLLHNGAINNMMSSSNNNNGTATTGSSQQQVIPTPGPPPLRHLPAHYATLLKNSNASTSSSTSDPLSAAGSDHKLRWIDYRNRPAPAFPPRIPGLSGIPSGFRNPPSTTALPAVQSAIPSFPPNPHSNPQLVHGFGPSSTNPVGFAGSVPAAPASFPASNVNQDRKRPMPNITRVERKFISMQFP